MRGRPIPYKTSDGRWRVVFVNGAGKRQYLSGASATEAQDKLDGVLAAVKAGLPVTPTDSVERYLKEWLREQKAGGHVRPTTWHGYSTSLTYHAIPRVGRLKLADLTPRVVRMLYVDLQEAGVGLYAINTVHRVLHKAVQDAVVDELLARNPVALVAPPALPDPHMVVLTFEERRAFLEAIHGHPDETLFTLAVQTGARQGELAGLRWMDYHDGSLHLTRAMTDKGPQDLKTRAGRRRIVLAQRSLATLERLRAETPVRSLRRELDYVFPGLVVRNLRHRFKTVLRHSGLPEIRFHDLRHTCATLLLLRGVSVPAVSALLGHKNPSVTMRVYAHVLPSTQEEVAVAVNLLDEAAS